MILEFCIKILLFSFNPEPGDQEEIIKTSISSQIRLKKDYL